MVDLELDRVLVCHSAAVREVPWFLDAPTYKNPVKTRQFLEAQLFVRFIPHEMNSD